MEIEPNYHSSRAREEYPKGEIIDLLTIPDRIDVADALVADATSFFDHNKINLITSLLVNKHPYEKIFKRHGFLNVRRKVHVFYRYIEMDDEFKILETTDAGKIHLSRGDLM